MHVHPMFVSVLRIGLLPRALLGAVHTVAALGATLFELRLQPRADEPDDHSGHRDRQQAGPEDLVALGQLSDYGVGTHG